MHYESFFGHHYPPTPNGDLHIGHIAGPFLSADVFTRVQRQQGHDCALVSYSDDYQSYMLRRGIELDRNHQTLAEENTRKICETLDLVGIHIDNWMQPQHNRYFLDAVTEVYNAAYHAGAIYSKTTPEPYCSHCDKWGYEAFGRGLCNHCGVDSDASQCEGCAHTPDAAKMAEFRCKLCGGKMAFIPVEREFLQLSAYHNFLKQLFNNKSLRPPMPQFLKEEFELGPLDWGITRPHDGGLDLKSDGTRRIHTWFMGLAGYLASFRELLAKTPDGEKRFEQFCHSGQGKMIHFLGYDCAFSHLIVYPVLLSTLDTYRIEQEFYSNHFLTLKGGTLSTSRNYAIWARDIVKDYDQDSVRFYLSLLAPEAHESEFDLEKFTTWRNQIFLPTVDQIHERLKEEIGKSASLNLPALDMQVIRRLVQRWYHAASPTHFSMKSVAKICEDVLDIIRDRIALGAAIRSYVALLSFTGQSIFPELSRTLQESSGLSREEIFQQIVSASSVEYEI
ncbi:methionine--tRNA ligase [Rahnella perminowiae]|uniref:methionine--tRNA ligase n=1 Tax=Rahnella perminowiae TaxID=2816244 RepID=UPI00215BD0FC|nr:methionine--tRNA ligase [Rahnella perminowiae]